jgi:hypothetical protein
MFRYRAEPAALKGSVDQADARIAHEKFPELQGKVRLIVTSPPYIDTTDYCEDQWLRLWFLGGASRPMLRQGKDDRITSPAAYWQFLREAWTGVEPLLAQNSIMVVRIGGKNMTCVNLLDGLTSSLEESMPGCVIRALDQGVTTAIKPRETTVFRPGKRSTARVEHDFTFSIARTSDAGKEASRE